VGGQFLERDRSLRFHNLCRQGVIYAGMFGYHTLSVDYEQGLRLTQRRR